MRLLRPSTVKRSVASCRSASGANHAGCGPGSTRSSTGPPRSHLGDRAVRQVVAQRRRPRSGVQPRPALERPRSEAAQLVAGQTPQDLRSEQPPGDGNVGAQAPAHRAYLEQLPRGQRHHLAGRLGGAIDADVGPPSDHGDVTPLEATQPCRPGGELQRAGALAVTHQPVGQQERHGIGGARSRDADRRHRPPTRVLAHGAQPRHLHLQNGARSGRRRPDGGLAACRLHGVVDGRLDQADLVARRQRGIGRGVYGEEGEPTAPNQLPAPG